MQKAPFVQGRKGPPSAVPPWFSAGFQPPTNSGVALCSPPTRALAVTGEPGETCPVPAGPVRPLDSQATFGGGRCEGLQPVTLFSSLLPRAVRQGRSRLLLLIVVFTECN